VSPWEPVHHRGCYVRPFGPCGRIIRHYNRILGQITEVEKGFCKYKGPIRRYVISRISYCKVIMRVGIHWINSNIRIICSTVWYCTSRACCSAYYMGMACGTSRGSTVSSCAHGEPIVKVRQYLPSGRRGTIKHHYCPRRHHRALGKQGYHHNAIVIHQIQLQHQTRQNDKVIKFIYTNLTFFNLPYNTLSAPVAQ
jgi:hypothetical protein